jgi:hypothetical protein
MVCLGRDSHIYKGKDPTHLVKWSRKRERFRWRGDIGDTWLSTNIKATDPLHAGHLPKASPKYHVALQTTNLLTSASWAVVSR